VVVVAVMMAENMVVMLGVIVVLSGCGMGDCDARSNMVW
jgi:hypothetical protein